MILGFFRFIVWALVAVFIVQMGWDEPLSYRFKSPLQVAMDEQLYAPPAPPRPSVMTWQPNGTALDRGGYKRNADGGIQYNPSSVDQRGIGTSTETGTRLNVFGRGH
jgi:hypothetical protein